MKLILAIIPGNRVEAVREALERFSPACFYTTEVRDHLNRTQKFYRGAGYASPGFAIRVEVLMPNERLVSDAVEAVALATSGGSTQYGGGNVVVLNVEDWIPLQGIGPALAHIAA